MHRNLYLESWLWLSTLNRESPTFTLESRRILFMSSVVKLSWGPPQPSAIHDWKSVHTNHQSSGCALKYCGRNLRLVLSTLVWTGKLARTIAMCSFGTFLVVSRAFSCVLCDQRTQSQWKINRKGGGWVVVTALLCRKHKRLQTGDVTFSACRVVASTP